MKFFGRQNEIKELAQEKLSMDRQPLLTKAAGITSSHTSPRCFSQPSRHLSGCEPYSQTSQNLSGVSLGLSCRHFTVL